MHRWSFRAFCIRILFAALLFTPLAAGARPCREELIPNGLRFSCSNCHIFPGGPRNDFGIAIELLVSPGSCDPFWSPALAALDSDGDGATNGQELQDPGGVWRPGQPNPGNPEIVTNPGDLTSDPPVPSDHPITVKPFVAGISQPTFMTPAVDGTDRLFVLSKSGRVRIVHTDGTLLATPFLDIAGPVKSSGHEQGLLGIAFHPEYATNGRFYVSYNNEANSLVIEEYQASGGDPNLADVGSARTLLTIPKPATVHNGGMLLFGPPEDGGTRYLYISTGDGGSYCDLDGNSQSLQSLLGKILRIDVDGGVPYGVPASNPFFGVSEILGEVYAYGLRNPWRFSFDEDTGRIFCGDVGQELYEEINLIEPGRNYGWPVLEGVSCLNNGPPPATFFPLPSCAAPPGATTAIHIYAHDFIDPDDLGGGSVTGGYVYRGTKMPFLAGDYIYGDYNSARIWRLHETNAGEWIREELLNLRQDLAIPAGIASFAEDADRELYICDLPNHRILKLELDIPLRVGGAWALYD